MARFSRRAALRGLAATGVGAAAYAAGFGPSRFVRTASADPDDPRYLIVIGCFGGASMLDSFMPVDVADAYTHEQRGTVISYPTVQPEGSNIRCVDRQWPRQYLERHAHQSVVMSTLSSSVNHFVAQARSVNGRDINAGRTMPEAIAAAHGSTYPLPNVNMGRGGYSEPGADASLDPRFRGEIVTNPVTFPLSMSGHGGILPNGPRPAQDPDVRAALVARARQVRDEQLETVSPFAQTFPNARTRRDLLQARRTIERRLEVDQLIEKLLFVPDLGEAFPINAWGLSSSEEADRILDRLPGAFPANANGTPQDRLQAQAALAYLLIRTGSSAAVTLTEPGTDGFLAFDQSHQSHRNAQGTHWDRVLRLADDLIDLLSTAEYIGSDGPTGTSLWDRSMIVFATEFGRDKWDLGGGFGTGHHLNNGLLVTSPLLAGNQSLGTPDPNNGFLSGWDGSTGESTLFDDVPAGEDPLFSDQRQPPGEEKVYGTLLKALGVSYEGQETLPAVLDRNF
ncbi:MAG: hypothetical protein KDA24_29325 [Deltaproteobacteria bacterium]|nr:hypothetical protein [Deltaproteobacteria bacterium]